MTERIYVIDSSFLIKWHREQPIDFYPSVWDRLSELMASGEAVLPREADREMQAHDDGLRKWLRDRAASVVEATDQELVTIAEIAARHPGWVRGRKNAADPFVVAAAASRSAVIVTDERAAGPGVHDRNLKIPNVASEYAVECITPTELVRRRGWIF